MRYRTLATDYDGTIAHDGRVDADTLAALERVRAAGLRLLLVTGREPDDLFDTFIASRCSSASWRRTAGCWSIRRPAWSGRSRRRAAATVAALVSANVPISVGHTIIATGSPHEQTVLEAIRETGVEWHVILNKGSVMILPAGVTKATGLRIALDELGLSAADTIGVGDAENDQAFLSGCGLGVAVANALPALKEEAALVTAGAQRGRGRRADCAVARGGARRADHSRDGRIPLHADGDLAINFELRANVCDAGAMTALHHQ